MPDGTAKYIHPEDRNLASGLEQKELDEIGSSCMEGYKADLESRKDWDEMHASWVRMFYQKDSPVNPPWAGSSEESLPMLTEACIQYAARARQALFPRRDFVTAIPVGRVDPKSKERAQRVARHIAWQCVAKDRSYKRNKDRLLLGQALHGSYFTKTYWDFGLKRWVVENVPAGDLVVAYGSGPRNIEDVERKTQRVPISLNKTRILANKGFFLTEFEPYQDSDDRTETQKAQDEAQGITPPSILDDRDCLALEQHTYLDLDGDGIAEPYIVTIDAQTEKVQRISIRYDTDEAGNPTNFKEPVEYFTHYPYIENPDGFYGLGLGHLIAQLNKSANKLLRQGVDAGTLQNILALSGFVAQSANIQGGELKIELGKFKKFQGSAEDLQKAFYQVKAGPMSSEPRETLQLLMLRSDRTASSTEAITGQTEKVMQPTTIMALVEQGLQVFASVYERVLESWCFELDKIYRLNGKFMDPQEYYAVQDSKGDLKQFTVGRDDYAPDMQIMPIADPKQATMQQRMTRAEAEKQAGMASPLTMNSPQHLYNLEYRYYEAIGTENIDEILPMPTGQTREDDAMMENLMVLQPQPVMPLAFANQDHDLHIKLHAEQIHADDKSGTMSSLQRSMLMQHIQSHERFKNAPGGGQGRDPAMGPAPGNGGGVGGVAQPGGQPGVDGNLLNGAPANAAIGQMSGQTEGAGPIGPDNPGRMM